MCVFVCVCVCLCVCNIYIYVYIYIYIYISRGVEDAGEEDADEEDVGDSLASSGKRAVESLKEWLETLGLSQVQV